MKSCRSRFWPEARWISISVSLAVSAFVPGMAAMIAPVAASSSAADSIFLRAEEPRAGLFEDAAAFARVAPVEAGSHSALSFGEMLQYTADQVVAEGKKPVIAHFFCTVYFTPREQGFTGEGGFDVTPDTRSSLGGRKFAKSFLRAVSMEGFGRMKEPAGGKHYLKYDGTWGYRDYPLGNRGNKLIDRMSAAVHRSNSWFSKGKRFYVLSPEVYHLFGSMEFEAADTGGGLYRSQIDLYWCEDDPLGPYPDTARAASCPVGVIWIVPVLFAK